MNETLQLHELLLQGFHSGFDGEFMDDSRLRFLLCFGSDFGDVLGYFIADFQLGFGGLRAVSQLFLLHCWDGI